MAFLARSSMHSNHSCLIALAAALSMMAIAGSGLEAEEILHVDSSTSSPGSARQWVYDGTQSSIGNAGPEIVLGTKGGLESVVPDLHLSFDGDVPADSGGRWRVETFGPYERAGDARLGDGAGVFKAPLTHLVVTPGEKALFIPNLPIEDLSIEFWIKPTRADSGEIVFLWKANRITGKTSFSQQISCIVLRNRLVFGFINFFTAPDGKPSTISLPGVSTLVPGVWSHHLVRFDASTGLLEYLMNGSAEAISYATSTGKQSGTIFTPIPGGSGRLEIAQNYTGLIDEFSIIPSFIADAALRRYPASGGSVLSPVLDLGATNTSLLSIGARFKTPGESAVHWSYRLTDSSVAWRDETQSWMAFSPGDELKTDGSPPRGRYIQIRMELYPDASGERSPSISSIKIRYETDRPPSPPSSIAASSGDKRITVRWSQVSEADIGGYMVYYGLSSGDYFGTGATEGPSPIHVNGQKSSSLTLNGLKNGTLYFVAVAAVDGAHPPHIGELSRETSARPSRVSP